MGKSKRRLDRRLLVAGVLLLAALGFWFMDLSNSSQESQKASPEKSPANEIMDTSRASRKLTYIYTYDSAGRLVSAVAPDGKKTQYEYTPQGLLKAVRLADGVLEFVHDADGNRIGERDPSGSAQYFYDPLDRLIAVIWNHGPRKLVLYDYGIHARPTRITVLDLSQLEKNSKLKGLLHELAPTPGKPAGPRQNRDNILAALVNELRRRDTYQTAKHAQYRVGYAYDSAGKLAEVATDWGKVTYSYSRAKGQIERRLPNGIVTRYTYSPLGRLISVRHEREAGKPIVEYHYEYSRGKLTKVSKRQGGEPLVTRYSWGPAGNLIRLELPNGNKIAYSYNKLGQLARRVEPEGHTDFAYNEFGWLAQVGKRKCQWDKNGNLRRVFYNPTEFDAQYDDRNLPRVVKIHDQTTRYTWDAHARPIAKQTNRGVEYTLPSPFSRTDLGLAKFNDAGKLTQAQIYDMGQTPFVVASNDREVRFLLDDGYGSARYSVDLKGTLTQHDTDFIRPDLVDQFIGQVVIETQAIPPAGSEQLPSDFFEKQAQSNLESIISGIQNRATETVINELAPWLGEALDTANRVNSAIEFLSDPSLERLPVIGSFIQMWTGKTTQERYSAFTKSLDALAGSSVFRAPVLGPMVKWQAALVNSYAGYTVRLFSGYDFDPNTTYITRREPTVAGIRASLRDRYPSDLYDVDVYAHGGGITYTVRSKNFPKKLEPPLPAPMQNTQQRPQWSVDNYGDPLLLALSQQTQPGLRESGGGGTSPDDDDRRPPFFPPGGSGGGGPTSGGSGSGGGRPTSPDNDNRRPPFFPPGGSGGSGPTSPGVGYDRLDEDKGPGGGGGTGGGGTPVPPIDDDDDGPPPFFPPGGGGVGPTSPGGGWYSSFHDPFSEVQQQLGGVELAATGEVFGDLGRIEGAVFDPKTKRLVLVGDQDHLAPVFRPEDLAVALYLVFGPQPQDPRFSLDPADPANPKGEWLKAVYLPERVLAGSSFGQGLFEADWLLKQYSFGCRIDGAGRMRQRWSKVPGFKSVADLSFESPKRSGGKENWARYWIVSDEMHIKVSGNSLYFDVAKMRVKAKKQVPDPTSPSGLRDVEVDDPIASEFAARFTRLYDRLAAESREFERVRELAKVVAFAKWLKQRNVPIDMEWVRNHVNRRSGSIGKVQSLSAMWQKEHVKPFRKGKQTGREVTRQELHLFGGVDLTVSPTYQRDDASSKALGRSVKKAMESGMKGPVFAVKHRGRPLTGTVLPVTPTGQEMYQSPSRLELNGTKYRLNAKGRVESSRTEAGTAAHYGYDNKGHLTRVALSSEREGYKLTGERTPSGSVWRYVNGRGHTFQYRYGAAGYLERLEVDGKVWTSYDYSPDTRTVQADIRGQKFQIRLTENGDLSEYKILGEGEPISTIGVEYNAAGLTTAVKENGTPILSVTYHEDGVSPTLIKTATATVRYEYEEDGRIKSVHHSAGLSASFKYADEKLAELQLSSGKHWVRYYYGAHGPANVQNSLGETEQYSYKDGKLRSIHHGDGSSTQYSYGARGGVKQIRLADGRSVAFRRREQAGSRDEKLSVLEVTVASTSRPPK